MGSGLTSGWLSGDAAGGPRPAPSSPLGHAFPHRVRPWNVTQYESRFDERGPIRTPDDAVDALWGLLVSTPSSWGRDRGPGSLSGGAARALGVLLVPVGFLCFALLLVFVLPLLAVCYDLLAALRGLLTTD